jgi:hypothetical protein
MQKETQTPMMWRSACLQLVGVGCLDAEGGHFACNADVGLHKVLDVRQTAE